MSTPARTTSFGSALGCGEEADGPSELLALESRQPDATARTKVSPRRAASWRTIRKAHDV